MPHDNPPDELAELIGKVHDVADTIGGSIEGEAMPLDDEEVRRAYPDAYPQPPAPIEPAAPEVSPTLLACIDDTEALAELVTSCACATCPVALWQLRKMPKTKDSAEEVIFCHCPRLHQSTYNGADMTQYTVSACDGREDELMRKGLEPQFQQPTPTNTP